MYKSKSSRSLKVSRRSPKASRRSSKVSRRSPKVSRRSPKVSRRSPKVSRRSPKASRRSPKVSRRSPKASRRSPKASRRSPKASRRSPKISKRSLQKYKEVPYKGKKWIMLKSYKDVKDIKNIEKINWNTKYKYNIIDKGIHLKKLNPVYKYNNFTINNLKTFEGKIDDFIIIINKNRSPTRQLNYLEEFRNDIRELRKDDLEYVYGVYDINEHDTNGNMSIDFIATNGDGSICYIRSVDLGGYNKVIINGIKLNLLSWFLMTKEDKNKLF